MRPLTAAVLRKLFCERYGFAYGTLAGRAEVGEERFSVEWDKADGAVWYDSYASSRPNRAGGRVMRGVRFLRVWNRLTSPSKAPMSPTRRFWTGCRKIIADF